MKLLVITWSIMENNKIMTHHENRYTAEELEQLVEAHLGTSIDTPLRQTLLK